MYFIIKCIISGLIVGVVSELGRKAPLVAAITASLPLTSILALIWLYRDTESVQQVAQLSTGIAIVVLPSILFFAALSLFLNRGYFHFYASLLSSCALMVVTYWVYIMVLKKMGVSI